MINILVFIGARGGSKGVKGKNFRPLLGTPLIVYTIRQALNWDKAARVIVSTDSKEIADIAREAGAEVPFLRDASLATDTASKGLAIKDALIRCERHFNERYDCVVDLDVTAPIRTREDLDKCLELYLEKKPKTLFSVVEAHKNPYFNMVEKKGNGNYEVCNQFNGGIRRRQDAPAVYAMNASIYFYDRDYVLASADPSPFSDRTQVYVMDDVAGVDIDREVDFKYVEFLAKEGLARI
jgi:CMP-N-acetylneuraminic acid synthetase